MRPEFENLPEGTVVIFLDVDGVLVTAETIGNGKKTKEHWDSPWYHAACVDPECVKRLAKIIKATGAKIVVSSTWRRSLRQMAGLKRALRDAGLRPRMVIIGTTPVHAATGDREAEINQWLRQHPEVTRYTSIDDDGVGAIPNVRPSWSTQGLQDEHIEEAVALLSVDRTPNEQPPEPQPKPKPRRWRKRRR